MNDAMEQARETFINESLDLLQDMESALIELQSNLEDEEHINSVFRAAHTIKGSAGLFGYDVIVKFTHKVEEVLTDVRAGKVALDDALILTLLTCRDHMESLIEQVDQGEVDEAAGDEDGDALIKELLASASMSDEPVESTQEPTPNAPVEFESPIDRDDDSPVISRENWHISLRFSSDVLRNGMDPLSFVRYLATLGQIMNITTTTDAIPALEEMDPETCYIGLEIVFDFSGTKQEIMDVFEFISEDSQVWVLPPRSRLDDYVELIEKLKETEEEHRVGELLIKCGALTEREVCQALAFQQSTKTEDEQTQPLGEVLIDKGAVHPTAVDTALKKQKKIKDNKIRESKSIRVDAERLDELINLVGELVIAGAGTHLLAKRSNDEELVESTFVVSHLVEQIRDRALSLRMVQIGEMFNRFNRVVRDISRELGKNIHLDIVGADTELDKSVVEKIGDPLTHLVRNSIDHGIESVEDRLAAGKPEQGNLKLHAYHDSGNIVIDVVDDGRGIDSDKVLQKAITNGLVSANQQLSQQEILKLVLEPGLSTKDQATDLSGRGVGMDVVRRNVEALRGTIDIDSVQGQGTTMRVRLPLTLSIIDGFLVGVGDSQYVLPLDSVVECIEHRDQEEHRIHEGEYISLRGEVLPYINLRQHFSEHTDEEGRKNIVVVQSGDQRAGLVVDDLMGEYQTVIKPLNKIFSQLSGISGSTILGNGEVAMILDIPSLVQQAGNKVLH